MKIVGFSLLSLLTASLSAMDIESLKKCGVTTIAITPNDPAIIQQSRQKEEELAQLRFNELNALGKKEKLEANDPNSKDYTKNIIECHFCKKLVEAKEQEIRRLKVEYPIDSPQAQEELRKIQERFDARNKQAMMDLLS